MKCEGDSERIREVCREVGRKGKDGRRPQLWNGEGREGERNAKCRDYGKGR